MLAPLAPHVAEELWARLGHPESLTYAPFPEADPAELVEDTVEIVVQVDGKAAGPHPGARRRAPTPTRRGRGARRAPRRRAPRRRAPCARWSSSPDVSSTSSSVDTGRGSFPAALPPVPTTPRRPSCPSSIPPSTRRNRPRAATAWSPTPRSGDPTTGRPAGCATAARRVADRLGLAGLGGDARAVLAVAAVIVLVAALGSLSCHRRIVGSPHRGRHPTTTTSRGRAGRRTVVVQVAGAVTHPGVVTCPPARGSSTRSTRPGEHSRPPTWTA